MAKTINIDDSIHKAAKVEAAKDGKTIKEWLEEVILQAAGEQKTDADGNG